MTKILLGWEILLALLSFVFYKVMKFIIGNIYTLYLIINKKPASQWRVLSQKTINAPLVLPVLMTKAPRWNTHAVIGTLGPFAVKESIAFNIETANNSARSWIAVVYNFPGYRTITSLESECMQIFKISLVVLFLSLIKTFSEMKVGSDFIYKFILIILNQIGIKIFSLIFFFSPALIFSAIK